MLEFPRWKVITIALATLIGVLLAVPNFLTDEQIAGLPDFMPKSQVTLGLDLQGGAHFLLEVDASGVIENMLLDKGQTIRDDLRDENILPRYRLVGDNVIFTLTNPEDRENALRVIRSSIVKVGVSLSSVGTDDVIIADGSGAVINVAYTEEAILEKKVQSVQQSIEVLRRRIDGTGTKEPTIQQNGADRILIQLPGIEDTEAFKIIFNETAQMNFHLTNQLLLHAHQQLYLQSKLQFLNLN